MKPGSQNTSPTIFSIHNEDKAQIRYFLPDKLDQVCTPKLEKFLIKY